MSQTLAIKKGPPAATIRRQVDIQLPEGVGEFITFDGLVDGKEHLAIRFASAPGGSAPVLVRLHSECLTGDVFGSARCDCGDQLREATATMAREGGVLLYLRQEGRGIGLYRKLDAYAMQDRGFDTFEANVMIGESEDSRDYTAAYQMLEALGVHRVRLLSNNPCKARQLRELGLDFVEVRRTGVFRTDQNDLYLKAKVLKGGHLIDLDVRPDALPEEKC